MELDSTYTSLWVVWGLIFAAIEGAALFNKGKGDTLSEHVWKWFAIKDKPTGYKLRRGSLGVFMAWLVAHFFGAV